ncbi:retrotransposon protein [Cucumis melo var. makuwa]|uniref:Retrotransposon protein n=1 Tax=Cucumis melo var. makuwa TaxID=1194695 RepID=A0A5A7T5R0_CUCMM|nr:retrotransposon protein [Cucumis melo var. makuwa]TYJ95883.1 retrotransposon protein [Cucumis melo var. makuwa]
MTSCDDIDEVDEGDSAYTTIAAIEDIQFIDTTTDGFGWNDEVKCIIAENELFDNWVKSHLATKGLLNKPFPYYDKLTYVFGSDRAMGRFAEMFADVGSNEPARYERFDIPDENKKFPSVYN